MTTPDSSLAPAPACEACGACCFGDGARYVRVTGDDHERLGAAAARWTHFLGHRCYMRMERGRCAALGYDAQRGQWQCRVYADRPQVCRDLERGGPACDAERARKADLAATAARPRDGVTRDGVTRDGVTRDGVTRDGVTRGGVTRDGVTRDGVTRGGVTRGGVTRGGVT
ncbi:MAG: YkgJ family cysteine cluster protein [Planctomycetota bacterium]